MKISSVVNGGGQVYLVIMANALELRKQLIKWNLDCKLPFNHITGN